MVPGAGRGFGEAGVPLVAHPDVGVLADREHCRGLGLGDKVVRGVLVERVARNAADIAEVLPGAGLKMPENSTLSLTFSRRVLHQHPPGFCERDTWGRGVVGVSLSLTIAYL